MSTMHANHRATNNGRPLFENFELTSDKDASTYACKSASLADSGTRLNSENLL